MLCRRYVLCLPGLWLLWSGSFVGQSSQPDFDAFLARFKTAVTQKDTSTLTTLMAPKFDFIRAENVPPSDVYSALNADSGRQWTNLQQAVQGRPIAYQVKDKNVQARALPCTPTDTVYNCLVVLQQDTHHHWQWKGMIMPTRY